jgi:sugar lactone lactonase YvrE
MSRKSFLSRLNAFPVRWVCTTLFCWAMATAGGMPLSAQVISADNLTPFQPREVGTTSDAKTVRIKLNYPRSISSIAVAPGFSEFAAGTPSGCVVDGHTINPGLSVCSVEVTFSPQYPGLRTAPLVVTDSAGIKSSVGLIGTGLAPQAALTPGIITTIAGNGQRGSSGDGGPATQASLSQPLFVALDGAGNLYISDAFNYRIRKVDTNGIITTVAGIDSPSGIVLDAEGNLYISKQDSPGSIGRVLKVDLNGLITIFAGNGQSGDSGDGGPAVMAALTYPRGLAADSRGNIYIADSSIGKIRKVDSKGIISTVAGGGSGGDGGPATQAGLGWPIDVAVDIAGNLYIAEQGSQRIRKVDTNGIITTIAGTGNKGFSGDGGPALEAELDTPLGVAVDPAGNVYFSDEGNERIRRIDTNGTIKTIAGGIGVVYSGDGGPATQAGMNPFKVAIDSAGDIFLADYTNQRVRKVDVSQSAVTFNSHIVGTTSPSREVIATNTGNQHIEFTDLSMSGDFGQLTGTARDCTDTTFLGVGFSCAIRITFAPTAVGSLTGSATVTDNSMSLRGTTQTIALSGTAVAP